MQDIVIVEGNNELNVKMAPIVAAELAYELSTPQYSEFYPEYTFVLPGKPGIPGTGYTVMLYCPEKVWGQPEFGAFVFLPIEADTLWYRALNAPDDIYHSRGKDNTEAPVMVTLEPGVYPIRCEIIAEHVIAASAVGYTTSGTPVRYDMGIIGYLRVTAPVLPHPTPAGHIVGFRAAVPGLGWVLISDGGSFATGYGAVRFYFQCIFVSDTIVDGTTAETDISLARFEFTAPPFPGSRKLLPGDVWYTTMSLQGLGQYSFDVKLMSGGIVLDERSISFTVTG
ncbi:hypothetical protein ES707_04063 [subsurface metagenome]